MQNPIEPNSKIALIVFTDGRFEYLTQTMQSLKSNVNYPFYCKTIVNDTGVPEANSWLINNYSPEFKIISHKIKRGLGYSIQAAWSDIPKDTEYIFHLEEDWLFNESICLDDLIKILKNRPLLAQMLLKRQPWGDDAPFGGYINKEPDAFVEYKLQDEELYWVEHTKFFSFNPCIYPYTITQLGIESVTEGKLGDYLKQLQEVKFGIFGKKDDAPRVTHIGYKRADQWMW